MSKIPETDTEKVTADILQSNVVGSRKGHDLSENKK